MTITYPDGAPAPLHPAVLPRPTDTEIIPGVPLEPVATIVDGLDRLFSVVTEMPTHYKAVLRPFGLDIDRIKPPLPSGVDGVSVHAIRSIIPLITQHAEEGHTPVTQEEITPLARRIGTAHKLGTTILGPGVRKLVEKFGARAINENLDSPSTEGLGRVASGVVEVLSTYENPQQQFDAELLWAVDHIRTVAHSHHTGRDVSTMAPEERRRLDREVTSLDYAVGVLSLVDSILHGQSQTGHELRTPMIQAVVARVLAERGIKPDSLNLSLKPEAIAIIAPNLAEAIDFALPNHYKNAALVESVRRHGPGFFKGLGTEAIPHLSDAIFIGIPKILKGIHDALPTQGADLRRGKTWLDHVLVNRDGTKH